MTPEQFKKKYGAGVTKPRATVTIPFDHTAMLRDAVLVCPFANCTFRYGLLHFRWEGYIEAWYRNNIGRLIVVDVEHVGDIMRVRQEIMPEAERHNHYGNLGHDSNSPYDGDYGDNTESDGQYK